MALIALGILAHAGTVRGAGQTLTATEPTVGTNDIGGGFRFGTHTLSVEAGAVGGVKILGGTRSHNLALASVAYGWMLGPVRGGDHWYRGIWEVRGELFGGSQYSPSSYYIVGLTPHLRYDFATGRRWIPFVDIGAGATATGIGRPDLSNTFEFNIQGGVGLHYLICKNWAVTAEIHYFHVSDAEMTSPNYGVNGVMGMVGVTRFF
jgi:opacity protein-like surface antigen